MELNIHFESLEDSQPKAKGKIFVDCLVLIKGARIDFGVWNKVHKMFWSPQYKKWLGGVTHYHQLSYKEDKTDTEERIEELENVISRAKELIDWAVDESDDNGRITYDGRGYLLSASSALNV